MKKALLILFVFGLALLSPIAFSSVFEITIEYGDAPSLSVEILDYPSSAPPNSSIYLTSRVTNVGSGDATSAWVNWTLPSGWSNTSGTLNVFIGTLQPGQTWWNNITATVGETTGTYTITSSTSSLEGVGDSDSKSIEISVAAPPPPPGPIEPLPQPGMSLILDPSTLEVYQTKSIYTLLRVKNSGTMDLNNIRVDINGLDSSWYSVEPASFDKMAPSEEVAFTITLISPGTGTYGFNIGIISDEKSETIDAILTVLELTPRAEEELEEKEREEERKEEVISSLNIIQSLLIVAGIIAPAIIAAYMILFLTMKRCALCGAKMKVTYKGKAFTEYKCTGCGRFETKSKGKK